MSMKNSYLMNIASFLYLLCYIPEAYANIYNKNANVYNIPEKVLMLSATTFALSYAITINDSSLIINYGPLLSLDVLMLIIRIYYAYFYKKGELQIILNQNDSSNPIHNIDCDDNSSHSSNIDENFDYDL